MKAPFSILLVFASLQLGMAQQSIKLSGLPPGANPSPTDLYLTTQNVSTSPSSDAVTFQQISNAVLANARVGANGAATISGATPTTTLTSTGSVNSESLTVQAGSGAYAAPIVFSTTGAVAGDNTFVNIAWPTSTNPTLNFYNASTGGTLIKALMGTSQGGYSTLQFVYNGTSWSEFNKGEIPSRQVSPASLTALGNAPTGSGNIVLATSPTLVTPNLGTPSAVNLANATFPASVTAQGNTFNQYGYLVPSAGIPAGSDVVIIGDSTAAIVSGTSLAQYVSAYPGFTSANVYTYGISGSSSGPIGTSSSGLGVMAASSPSYTEFQNGTQVATGTASVASRYPGSGNMYFCAIYGSNDVGSGESLATFESNMASIWTTAHGIGSRVYVVNSTHIDGSTLSNKPLSVFQSWLRQQTSYLQGSGAAYPDFMCDANAVFGFLDNGAITGNTLTADGLHLGVAGQKLYASLFCNSILSGCTVPSRFGDHQDNFDLEAYDSTGGGHGGYLHENVLNNAAGNAGNIDTSTFGAGNGGSIQMLGYTAQAGSINTSGDSSGGTGQGGNIDLHAYSTFSGGNISCQAGFYAAGGGISLQGSGTSATPIPGGNITFSNGTNQITYNVGGTTYTSTFPSATGTVAYLTVQTGTLSSGTATKTVPSGCHPWVQDTNSSLTNVGTLTVTVSGTTATITSTNSSDTSTFALYNVGSQ